MRARSGVSVSDSWKPQQQVLNSLNSCVKVSVRRRTEKGLRTSIQCAKLTLSNTCLVRFPRSTLLSPEQKQEQSDTRHDNTPCETHTVGLTLAPQNTQSRANNCLCFKKGAMTELRTTNARKGQNGPRNGGPGTTRYYYYYQQLR